MSSIFGGDTGLTYEDIQRKRKIADSLISANARSPRNIGEGLNAIGRAIAGRALEKRSAAAEKDLRAKSDEAFAAVFGGGPPSYTGPTMPDGSPGVIKDEYRGGGKGGKYADAIASIESAGSGDYSAIGPDTGKGRAYGRYQVMDFNVGPWTEKHLGQRMTPQEFLANPAAQDAVFNAEFGGYVQKYGNPQDAASVWFSGRPMSKAGNSSDGYTTVPEYVQKFTKAMGGTVARQATPAGDVGAIAAALGDPYIQRDPGKVAVLNALLGRAMQQPDPMAGLKMQQAQLGLEKDRLEIDKMRQPDPGFEIVPPEAAAALGLPDGAVYQKGPDGRISQVGGGGTSVTVNNQGDPVKPLGTKGDILVPDPSAEGGYRVVQAEGSEAARIAAEATDAAAARESAQSASGDVVITAADRARTADSERTLRGMFGAVAALNPSSQNAELSRQTEVLKSIASAEALNAMRRQSKTGGALGNVTEKELKLLSEQAGALDPRSPNFARDLADYERAILRTIHGKEEGDKIFSETRSPEKMSFDDFAANPDVQAAAKKYGVSVEDMWEMKSE